MDLNTAELMYKIAKKQHNQMLNKTFDENREKCSNRIHKKAQEGYFETDCYLIPQSIQYFKNEKYNVYEIDPQCTTKSTHIVNWSKK